MIPDKYVYSGEHPKDFYNAGTIELAGKFKGEERGNSIYKKQKYLFIYRLHPLNIFGLIITNFYYQLYK